jgi:Zn-dependent protease with chaperone function
MLDLEPQVLESIQRSRRKRYVERALVIIPVSLALAAIVALMIFSFKGNELVIAVAALIVAIGAVMGLVLAVQRNYRKFTLQANIGPQPSRELFADKLDSVSIGVGIPTPELVVLQLPTINAVAFQKSGRPVVGVTESAASGQVSGRTAEAMMAHEVAHVLIGDMLRPMNAWSLRAIAFASLLGLTLIAIPTAIFSLMEEPGFPPAVGSQASSS